MTNNRDRRHHARDAHEQRRRPPSRGSGPGRHDSGVVRTGSGDVYAGRDGNVYRKQDGSWQKYDNGNWGSVDKPQRTQCGHPARRRPIRSGRPDAVVHVHGRVTRPLGLGRSPGSVDHGPAQPRLAGPRRGHAAHPRLRQLPAAAAAAAEAPTARAADPPTAAAAAGAAVAAGGGGRAPHRPPGDLVGNLPARPPAAGHRRACRHRPRGRGSAQRAAPRPHRAPANSPAPGVSVSDVRGDSPAALLGGGRRRGRGPHYLAARQRGSGLRVPARGRSGPGAAPDQPLGLGARGPGRTGREHDRPHPQDRRKDPRRIAREPERRGQGRLCLQGHPGTRGARRRGRAQHRVACRARLHLPRPRGGAEDRRRARAGEPQRIAACPRGPGPRS